MTEETLSPAAIESAIRWLETERFPNHPMKATDRETWADFLAYMREGELRPALIAVRAGGFRPDPEKVLDAAKAARTHEPRSNDWNHVHPDGPAPETNREMNLRMLDEVRAANKIRSKYKEASK